MRTIEVTCTVCKKTHDEANVEFVNIEEDFEGRDVLTFVCPGCGETVKSKRRAK
jgi:endogenous inhibitor of DNA gyrase (YacG/DUF329 family)